MHMHRAVHPHVCGGTILFSSSGASSSTVTSFLVGSSSNPVSYDPIPTVPMELEPHFFY